MALTPGQSPPIPPLQSNDQEHHRCAPIVGHSQEGQGHENQGKLEKRAQTGGGREM